MRKIHISLVWSRATTMSKKGSSSVKKSKNDTKATVAPAKPIGPIQINKTGDIAIKIHAKPGSKQNAITDLADEGVGVQIAAPPIDGEANTELIKYLSGVLKLRKSDLSLDRGSKSREKTVLVDKTANISVDRVRELIEHEKNDM